MSNAPSARGALALAQEAYALVQVSPRRALALADRALVAARTEGDAQAEVAAMHALTWAQFELGEPAAARTVRAGIRVAERYRDRRGAALLRRRLAFMHALAGRARAADREINQALELLEGIDRARSQVFRVEIHRKAQSPDLEADRTLLADVAGALRLLRRNGDQIWEARLVYNRGLLLLDRGELDTAEADLRRARSLYESLGASDAAADAASPLAEVALQRGDLVSCLETIERLELSLPPGHLGLNLAYIRMVALTHARLLPEARLAGERLFELCTRSGHDDLGSRALLDLAALAVMAGDVAAARHLATSVGRSFAARGKPVNAALARGIALRARLQAGDVRKQSVRSALQIVATLEGAGWRRDALRGRVLAARLALAAGSPSVARRELELAQPLALRGTVSDRIDLRHAQALLRMTNGDARGAERLLVAGLRLLEEYRAALGADELRATVSSIGVELAATGIGISLESGRPTKALAWAERMRANSLRLPSVTPPADPRLHMLQTELRKVSGRSRVTSEIGRPAYRLAGRRAELEAAIRSRTRLTEGGAEASTKTPRHRQVARVLGERALVEYVEHGSAFAALTIVEGRLALHRLKIDDPATEVEWLRFGLGRLARGAGGDAEDAAALAGTQGAASALERLLVEPIASALGKRGLVIVPTGSLHALPWGTLPSLRGRPVVVAPSLAVWLDLAERPRSRRRKTVLIAGPRLRHATAEVSSIAELHQGATVLRGRAATAEAVLAALDGAALAHLACHGSFRSDSPLFSALELADGPLNVYELQRLRRAPEVVVLSACDLAQSDLRPGDELLGLASALLGMGTRTIVASVVPVPDAGARKLMLDLHRRLVAGEDIAAALAHAQAHRPESGFVCLGAA
jgi:hypothetical protein